MLDVTISPYFDATGTEVIIGDDIINMNPHDDFNIHFPMRRGELNLHGGIGGSLSAIITDLQVIWEFVLEVHLGIPLK